MSIAKIDYSAPWLERIGDLVDPTPGRLEFTLRMTLICVVTVYIGQRYETPDTALSVFVIFFMLKSDRMTTIVTTIVMMGLVTFIVTITLLIALMALDYPFWRFLAIVTLSFVCLFATSATKLKPFAYLIPIMAGYSLDVFGRIEAGEIATRAMLYVWLIVAIPAAVTIIINLMIGPAPRRLVEQLLESALRHAALLLRMPESGNHLLAKLDKFLFASFSQIPNWLKRAAMEKTSLPADIAALKHASHSTTMILTMVRMVVTHQQTLLSVAHRKHLADVLEQMADVLQQGGYPQNIRLTALDTETMSPMSHALWRQLQSILEDFTGEHGKNDSASQYEANERNDRKTKNTPSRFFVDDAFTNPEHVQFAIKGTAAAMFCYVTYHLLDWPGIHTCFLTCYIVGLSTTAESMEKLGLRFGGALVGMVLGIGSIVFVMPHVTSIGGLLIVIALGSIPAAWVAGGGQRVVYLGIQISFAFYLCILQGASPGFDMTIARDRVIGILFGNIAVAIVFTQFWPVSLSKKINPAIEDLFTKLAALAHENTLFKQRALTTKIIDKIGQLRRNLSLVRYEPSHIRPSEQWLRYFQQVENALTAGIGPLLIASKLDKHELKAPEKLAHWRKQLSVSSGFDQIAYAPTVTTISNVATSKDFLNEALLRIQSAVLEEKAGKPEGKQHASA